MLYENRANGSVEDIAAIIGYTATCTLIEWFGGLQLWVPTVTDETHQIGRVLGMPAFRALVKAYGGTALFVPTDHFREQVKRDRIVASMVKHGHGTKQIAATIGLKERQVQYIRTRLEEAGVLPMVLGG